MSKKPSKDRKRAATKPAKAAKPKKAAKTTSAAGSAAHAEETEKRRRPVKQQLPGMEQPHDEVLERLCLSIGTQREVMNAARIRIDGDTAAALQRMQATERMQAMYHDVELVRVAGADKLRVHLIKTAQQPEDLDDTKA